MNHLAQCSRDGGLSKVDNLVLFLLSRDEFGLSRQVTMAPEFRTVPEPAESCKLI
jgi:hypothetical protein